MPIQTLYATSHITGALTNPATAVGNTPTTWAGALNVNSNYTSRWALGDPTDPLTSGATQTIRVLAKKGSNSGTPTIALNLYENGTLVQALLSATNVTSTTGQTLTATFASSAITDRTGVEVEVVETSAGGSPSARNSAQIAYIAWDADATPPSSFSRTGSDPAGAADAVTKTLILARSASDATSLTDAAVRTLLDRRAPSDSTSSTDAATRQSNRSRSGGDAASATDTLAAVPKFVRTGSDAAGATSLVSRVIFISRESSDSAPALDLTTRSGDFTTQVTAADSASSSDAATRTSVYARYNPRRAG